MLRFMVVFNKIATRNVRYYGDNRPLSPEDVFVLFRSFVVKGSLVL